MADAILYDDFIEAKRLKTQWFGFEPSALPAALFDFQKDIVTWACKKGRAAIFADTGLGKRFMQIAWAAQVASHSYGKVLILAPLCVAHQTVKEAEKLGISIQYCRSQTEVRGNIVITNYEMLDKFDVSTFSGVVLDESSILKSYMGKTKRELIEACS